MSQDSEKYDRQLRMWGEEAQRLLESAHVCVIGASTVGAEALKCVALPGIGAFTVVDSAIVTTADCGTNFFVRGKEDIGKSRAQVVSENIAELNPYVKAHFVDKMPEDDAFWSQFNIVVSSQTSSEVNAALSKRLRRLGVPLLIVKSYGMIGSIRVDSPDHLVFDEKSDTRLFDLRVSAPFPELIEFVNKPLYSDLRAMDSVDHSHIPFVVLLILVLREWQKTHPSSDARSVSLPKSSQEKEEFKRMITSLSRSPDEENFHQALDLAYYAWAKNDVPDNVQKIFADPRCADPTDDTWIVVSALKKFVDNEGHGMLPLQGSLPDMTALTDDYVALQRIYHDHAEADIAIVMRYAQEIKAKVASAPVPESLIRQLCKNASSLLLISYPPVHMVPSNAPASGSSPDIYPTGDYNCGFSWALVLEAAEVFAKEHGGRWPGRYPATSTRDEDLKKDALELTVIVKTMLKARNYAEDLIKPEVINEMVRCGGYEIHCTSTVMGALIGQEIVKLVTHCYVPLDNCAIYNGFSYQVATYSVPQP